MSPQFGLNLGRWLAALVLTFALLGGTVAPTPAKAGADVSVDFFYDSLEPQGRWVDHWKYGRVWYPTDVEDDWRPYTRGRWVWTEDYGWYWDSNERFGWATYHYGRWDLDEDYGWIWVPGHDWGPAWVDWRDGGGHIGWAPLPPAVVWRDSRFDYGGIDIVSDRYRSTWCFVPIASFVAFDIGRHVLPPARNVTIIKNTTNITNYSVVNNTFVNKSVNVTRIEAATKTVIKPVQVVQASAPTALATRSSRPRISNPAQPSQLSVFRPQVTAGARPPDTAGPATASNAPTPSPAGIRNIEIIGKPQATKPSANPQGLAAVSPAPVPSAAAVPVLPKGGVINLNRPQAAVAGQQAQSAAPLAAQSAAQAKSLRDLEQRQTREAARQRREQVIERYVPSRQPRPDIQQRQAAERAELQRIQQSRRVAVQNRVAIAPQPQRTQPQRAVQPAAQRPAPAPQPHKPEPPQQKSAQPGQPG